MGSQKTYKCLSCGLTSLVSGGPDRNMSCFTETVWCNDCKLLQDVRSKYVKNNDLSYEFEVEEVDLECYSCKSEDVKPWQIGQPCPACGGIIQEDPHGIRCLSD